MDAQKSLEFAHDELRIPWRRIAEMIGCYSPAYWLRVARGDLAMSRRADDAFRRLLGRPVRGVKRISDMTPAQIRQALQRRES